MGGDDAGLRRLMGACRVRSLAGNSAARQMRCFLSLSTGVEGSREVAAADVGQRSLKLVRKMDRSNLLAAGRSCQFPQRSSAAAAAKGPHVAAAVAAVAGRL